MCTLGSLGAFKSGRSTSRSGSLPLNHSKSLNTTTSVVYWDICIWVHSKVDGCHSAAEIVLGLVSSRFQLLATTLNAAVGCCLIFCFPNLAKDKSPDTIAQPDGLAIGDVLCLDLFLDS